MIVVRLDGFAEFLQRLHQRHVPDQVLPDGRRGSAREASARHVFQPINCFAFNLVAIFSPGKEHLPRVRRWHLCTPRRCFAARNLLSTTSLPSTQRAHWRDEAHFSQS